MKAEIITRVSGIIDQASVIGIEAEALPTGVMIGAEVLVHLRDAARSLAEAKAALASALATAAGQQSPPRTPPLRWPQR